MLFFPLDDFLQDFHAFFTENPVVFLYKHKVLLILLFSSDLKRRRVGEFRSINVIDERWRPFHRREIRKDPDVFRQLQVQVELGIKPGLVHVVVGVDFERKFALRG